VRENGCSLCNNLIVGQELGRDGPPGRPTNSSARSEIAPTSDKLPAPMFDLRVDVLW